MASGAPNAGYVDRRARLETYFDRTAIRDWERLTSDTPVSGIRATVRAGRDRMRAMLLSRLPDDLTGVRILDAGCGTGALAVEAAWRGASVVAIDIAPRLIAIARDRMPAGLAIDWRVGDLRDRGLGRFDHVVAMDSLIHYASADIADTVATLFDRTGVSLLFTFAPSTRPLAVMHAVGRLFPRGDRAPAIAPVRETRLRGLLDRAVPGARIGWSEQVSSGFYTSRAMELVPA